MSALSYRNATARLIYPSTIAQKDAEAAMAGMASFEGFGVHCEGICVRDKDIKKVRDVLRGEELFSLVIAKEPVVRNMSFVGESILGVFFDKKVYGLGLTSERLREEVIVNEFSNSLEGRIGVSRTGAAGIISVSRFLDLDTELRAAAVSSAAAHEMGHVFGLNAHCASSSCIMQENTNHIDFIEKFAKARLDFCRGCVSRIRRFVDSCPDPVWETAFGPDLSR
jgi:hypothetical protein